MTYASTKGTGLLHRLPPEIKLGMLFGLSVLVFVLGAMPSLALVAGAVILVILAFCPAALGLWLRSWPLLLTLGVVVAWTAFAESPGAGLVVAFRLGSLSLFATAVTATTTIGQFVDTLTALARPLERIGLANARDIGLAIGLVIRFVPDIHERYRAVADAHRARGLRMRLSTVIVPMVVGTIRTADEIADAIDARGIRTDHDRSE